MSPETNPQSTIRNPQSAKPLIAILAGGQSRRMGTDKARLPISDTSWLAHIAQVAMQTPCRVAVVGRPGANEEAMAGVPSLPDERPGLGPMGGLLTALRYAEGPVIAVGCDMPLLTPAAFGWLLARADEAAGPLGLAVRSASGLEPLFSCYTAACLPVVEGHIAQRRLSLQSLLTEPAFRIVEAPAWVQDALRNINTPEERARLGL